jgi:hypothetical protein
MDMAEVDPSVEASSSSSSSSSSSCRSVSLQEDTKTQKTVQEFCN